MVVLALAKFSHDPRLTTGSLKCGHAESMTYGHFRGSFPWSEAHKRTDHENALTRNQQLTAIFEGTSPGGNSGLGRGDD